MGDQHRRAAGSERRPERDEVPARQVVHGGADLRQLLMRVDRRASVAGEVLGDGQEPLAEHRLDGRDAAPGDDVRSRRECAVADHRARRIDQAVEHRREPGVEPGGTQLAGHGSCYRRRQAQVAGASNRCRRRKAGERRGQAVNPSTLVIDHDEHVGAESSRRRRERQHGLEARAVAREQDDAPEPGLLGQRDEVVGNRRPLEAGGQRVAGPDLHTAILRHGSSYRKLAAKGLFSRLVSSRGERTCPG